MATRDSDSGAAHNRVEPDLRGPWLDPAYDTGSTTVTVQPGDGDACLLGNFVRKVRIRRIEMLPMVENGTATMPLRDGYPTVTGPVETTQFECAIEYGPYDGWGGL